MKLNKTKSWFKWSRVILSQRWNTVWIVISSSRLSKKSFTRFTNDESYVLLLIKTSQKSGGYGPVVRYGCNPHGGYNLWSFGPGSGGVVRSPDCPGRLRRWRLYVCQRFESFKIISACWMVKYLSTQIHFRSRANNSSTDSLLKTSKKKINHVSNRDPMQTYGLNLSWLYRL